MIKRKKVEKFNRGEIIIYKPSKNEVELMVRFEDEMIWLSLKQIAKLFDRDKSVISRHLQNIFKEKELFKNSVVAKIATTAVDGKTYQIEFYSLDAILSVGYRVNSQRATQFRIWATRILKQFAIKGFVLDRKRLENGSFLNKNYFDELLEEIREIRLSERNFYQKITDIYATAIDYSPKAYESKEFFATVQNKLHFAITGKTAAEIISDRVSSKKEKMGLTSWRRSPHGKIMPSDTAIAKNYLDKKELEHLNRIGNMYLDYAEM
ncbi:cell filamentation protein Fic, partial [bacterium]